MLQDVIRDLSVPFRIHDTGKMEEHEILGGDGHVGFELEPPVAFWELGAKEVVLALFDGLRHAVGQVLRIDRLRPRFSLGRDNRKTIEKYAQHNPLYGATFFHRTPPAASSGRSVIRPSSFRPLPEGDFRREVEGLSHGSARSCNKDRHERLHSLTL